MVKNLPAVQETGFDPWVRKIPWKREWLPTPVFLPGEHHGQRSLVGYIQSMGSQRVGYDWATNTHLFHSHIFSITKSTAPKQFTSLPLSHPGTGHHSLQPSVTGCCISEPFPSSQWFSQMQIGLKMKEILKQAGPACSLPAPKPVSRSHCSPHCPFRSLCSLCFLLWQGLCTCSSAAWLLPNNWGFIQELTEKLLQRASRQGQFTCIYFGQEIQAVSILFGKRLLPVTKNRFLRDFPGGPAVGTPCFHCRGHGFDPWSGN